MNTLLALGTVGPVLFMGTFLADGATRHGYSPTRHAVSALSLGPRGWLQKANFVVYGTLVGAAAVGIYLATEHALLTAAVALLSVALVLSGVFDMDPMHGYPPGAPEGVPAEVSTEYRVHDTAGAAVFLLALPGAAVLAGFAVEDAAWSVYSWVTAGLILVLFAVFVRAFARSSPVAGLLQRAMIITGMTWFGLTCWHLMDAPPVA